MATKKIDTRNNPNKANQYVPDPRQNLFLSYYLDPKSESFSNAFKSAVKAGYTDDTARVMTSQMPTWLSESLQNNSMLEKAEENLLEFLLMDTFRLKEIEEGKVIPIDDPQLKKIKADISKFVAERLGKEKWSQRREHTGKDGSELKIIPETKEIKELVNKFEEELKQKLINEIK